MKFAHYLVCRGVLSFFAFIFPFLLATPSVNTQTSTVTVEYTINANNRDAWSGDSHTGNPNHEVRINGYNSTNEPYEFVGNDSDAESAGIEFQLAIPQRATIQNAFITVKAGSFQNISPTGGMEIHLYNVASAEPFANGFFGDLVNHHPAYTQTIFWNTNTTWTNGSVQQTPDISSLVRIFVNRADYAPGNYIGFAITGGTIQSGRYYGWEDYFANGTPAKLTVSYVANATPPPTSTPTPTPTNRPTVTPTVGPTVTATATQTPTAPPTNTPTSGSQQLTIQVASSSDDVNQDGSSNFTTTGSPMWLGTGQSTSVSYTGLRFTGVRIPRNATITNAYIEFYSVQKQWITVNMQLSGDNVGNSAVFTLSNKPSQRLLTTQKANYNSGTEWLSSRWYPIDGLAPVIQAIVNRSDWQSGNALSVILKGTGPQYGRKSVQSYDGNPAFAPRLVIKYQ